MAIPCTCTRDWIHTLRVALPVRTIEGLVCGSGVVLHTAVVHTEQL